MGFARYISYALLQPARQRPACKQRATPCSHPANDWVREVIPASKLADKGAGDWTPRPGTCGDAEFWTPPDLLRDRDRTGQQRSPTSSQQNAQACCCWDSFAPPAEGFMRRGFLRVVELLLTCQACLLGPGPVRSREQRARNGCESMTLGH